MRSFKKALRTFAVGATLALLAVLGLASPARAGLPCDTIGLCGRVVNASNSAASIAIYDHWQGGNTPAGIAKRLPIGSDSKYYNRDTDGFCIVGGKRARVIVINGTYKVFDAVISGCKKIRDNEHATVIVLR